ncbi:MAG: preprotein translocase subunit SecE [Oscillospiraceae bacterium]|nr:preprotein translocase subunit SecE [Oscillospiraceae bacterium]
MAEVKKENWFKRKWDGLTKWFRGMKSELKKVVWPSWSQVVNNTVVVIVVSVIFAVIIGLIDWAAYEGIKALIGAVG